jgi:hypothetical protein
LQSAHWHTVNFIFFQTLGQHWPSLLFRKNSATMIACGFERNGANLSMNNAQPQDSSWRRGNTRALDEAHECDAQRATLWVVNTDY